MSSSLLISKYLDKLYVNRLQVNELKVKEVLPQIDSETKSYLYSAILNNAEFKKVEKNIDYDAELIIDVSEQLQEVIQFTDRPFTQSSKISIQLFVQLFLIKSPNSFEVDPPNVVLSFDDTQKSYTMSLSSELNDKVVFNLKLLEGEEHTQENFTGTINMFVDDSFEIINQQITFYFKESSDLFEGNFVLPFTVFKGDWGGPAINTLNITDTTTTTTTSVIPTDSNFNPPTGSLQVNGSIQCGYNFTFTYNEKSYSFTNDEIYFTLFQNNSTYELYMTDLVSYKNKTVISQTPITFNFKSGTEIGTIIFNIGVKRKEDQNYFLNVESPKNVTVQSGTIGYKQPITEVAKFKATEIGYNMYNFDSLSKSFNVTYSFKYISNDTVVNINETLSVTSTGITN